MNNRLSSAVHPTSDTPPTLAPPVHWPPRIPPSRAKWWMRLRDLLLTMSAWTAYFWLLRQPIAAFIVWLSPQSRERLEQVVDVDFELELLPYIWVAGAFIAGIVIAGLLRRRILRRRPSIDEKILPLQPEQQFASAGVASSELLVWRESSRLNVHFDANGQIAAATRVDPKTANGS